MTAAAGAYARLDQGGGGRGGQEDSVIAWFHPRLGRRVVAKNAGDGQFLGFQAGAKPRSDPPTMSTGGQETGQRLSPCPCP